METQMSTELSPAHGHKRHAEDNLDSEQRLTKRFNLLNLGIVIICTTYVAALILMLENIGKLYIPVEHQPTPPRRSRSNAFSDSMSLDETRDRVYIHNLDDELSDAESDGEKLVFLPDIEQRLTKIPKSVLLGQAQPHTSNEVVLYSVPESISVPREQDNVRKAIIESRERVRQQIQLAETHTVDTTQTPALLVPQITAEKPYIADSTFLGEPAINIYDEDVMDIG